MKKMFIRFFITLHILLGGYSYLHAATHKESVSISPKATLTASDTSRHTEFEGISHHNKDFVANSSFFQHFAKGTFDTADSENEEDEDEKENEDDKVKLVSSKKSVEAHSYVAILFNSQTPEILTVSVSEKSAPVYPGFCCFSSDSRLYLIFRDFRI